VVFSHHDLVAVEQCGKTYDVVARPGAFYVVGEEPMTLLRVREHSDTLEIYPDMDFIEASVGRRVILEPTLGRTGGLQQFCTHGAMLGIAHVLREVCLGVRELTPIESSSLEHAIANQLAGRGGSRRLTVLSSAAIRRTTSYVEEMLDQPITLEALASQARLSQFHFARAFKHTVGLPPHRYVIARKLERVKNRILTSRDPIADIAISAGFENLHHFRRLFQRQFGVRPAEMRAAAMSSPFISISSPRAA
jgi:AraC family transcriptional regulator